MKKKIRTVLNYLPLFGIIGLIGYAYYVLIVVMSSNFLIHGYGWKVQGGLYIAFFNVILVMVLAHLIRTLFPYWFRKEPMSPLDLGSRLQIAESPEEITAARKLMYKPIPKEGPIYLEATDAVRFCTLCQCLKPERTHHCSTCSKCILKMDHHCVWLNKCIAWPNYKFFCGTLFWGFLGLAFGFGTTLQVLIWQVVHDKLVGNSGQLLAVCIIFGLSGAVVFALLIYHIGLLVPRNLTTIEQLDWQDAKAVGGVPEELQHYMQVRAWTPAERKLKVKLRMRPLDLGTWTNWKQVFGGVNKAIWWISPVFTAPASPVAFPHRQPKKTGLAVVGDGLSPENV